MGKLHDMSSNAKRLGKYAKERRAELYLTQYEVWQSGGPSNTTLTAVENGLLETLTRTTARKLDAGLKWEPGSARATWEGGEPTPLSAEQPNKGEQWLREQIGIASLDEQLRQRLLEALDEGRRSG